MRRLGRQRGMVLFFDIVPQFPRPKARVVNKFDGPPTTACFTRAPAKPTNHSRYTSQCGGRPRCRGCHDRPAGKARSKAKRAHKLRSRDAGLNHGLFFHYVMGPAHAARFRGASATEILYFVYDHDCYYGE